MQVRLELLPLFFPLLYATCTLRKQKDHIETLHKKGRFPYDGYDSVIFLTLVQNIGIEQVVSFQTAEKLRYTLVIAHNIAMRVHEQDI
jgi:hypothetical protein